MDQEPALLDPAKLTWTCHICGEERPDAAISVAYRPVPAALAQFPGLRFHVRYCNDRPACLATANEPGPWTGGAR